MFSVGDIIECGTPGSQAYDVGVVVSISAVDDEMRVAWQAAGSTRREILTGDDSLSLLARASDTQQARDNARQVAWEEHRELMDDESEADDALPNGDDA